MKSLKLLSKKYFLILLFFLFFELNAQSQEPADIWNIEKKITTEESTIVESINEKNISQNSIYEMQSKKKNLSNIEEDQTLISKETEIIGLYDPAQNGLNINMWANSNGEQILSLMKKIMQMNLSNDASEILNILLLTNTYYPDRNITKEQFLKIKGLSNEVDSGVLILFWQFAISSLEELDIVSNQHLSIEMFLIRLMYLSSIKSKKKN